MNIPKGFKSPAQWHREQIASKKKIDGLPSGVKMDLHAVRIPSRPSPKTESEWEKTAIHYSVTVTLNGVPFHCFYSLGSGHRWWDGRGTERPVDCEPLPADVLHSLIADASLFRDCTDVDDFAEQFCEGVKPSEVMRQWEECRKTDEFLTLAMGEHRQAVEEYFQDY